MKTGLAGQLGKQRAEPLVGDDEELAIRRDAHDGLGDAESDDLRVGQASTGVLQPAGQEIVGGAEHRSERLAA